MYPDPVQVQGVERFKLFTTALFFKTKNYIKIRVSEQFFCNDNFHKLLVYLFLNILHFLVFVLHGSVRSAKPKIIRIQVVNL